MSLAEGGARAWEGGRKPFCSDRVIESPFGLVRFCSFNYKNVSYVLFSLVSNCYTSTKCSVQPKGSFPGFSFEITKCIRFAPTGENLIQLLYFTLKITVFVSQLRVTFPCAVSCLLHFFWKLPI